MPVKVAKRGNKYCVVGPDGKLEGKCYSNKEQAVKQVQAINLSKRRQEGKPTPNTKSGIELMAKARINVQVSALGEENGMPSAPAPIIILSDGTPEGTKIMVHGQPIEFTRMDLYCSKSDDYPHCSLSITQKTESPDGQTVERTMTLRKESSIDTTVATKRKLDPKAKVRNRGDVVFSSTHSKVTDNKDHFPINDANQARNALSRVAQYNAAPKWWSGSLKQLQSAVRNAVQRKFKKINVTEANTGFKGFALYYATGSFRWVKENT